MTPAVSLNNISFSYKAQGKTTVSGIGLSVAQGERFGLFGPNGAGKTTLMGIMTGLLHPQQGEVSLLGIEPGNKNEFKKLFGYVPQDFAFYPELNPIENLEFFGAWSGLNKAEIRDQVEMLLTIFGLQEVRKRAVKKFSGGMKRRVNIAIGVMHKPKILFLDEPTVGVDVQTRHAIIDYLKQLNKQGTTLIYTSHHLKEAEDLCERIALMDAGKIIVHDKLDALVTNKENSLEELFLKLTGKDYRD